MAKKKVLVFYDHFHPAWKAGGPVQSLVNLVRYCSNHYAFFIVCKPHEMGSSLPLPGIAADSWINWEGNAQVLYRRYGSSATLPLQALLAEVQPDVVYINGLFSVHFNILPLYAALRYQSKHAGLQVLVAARGMLHPGALSQKALKKQIFLRLLRWLGWHRRIRWHATDAVESHYIQQQFGSRVKVIVAGNFPNLLAVAPYPPKQKGFLQMATIALISPMKNHLEVIKALPHVQANLTWDIYGPVKDAAYWKACEAAIAALPATIQVRYHGALAPTDLPAALQQFQLLVMPSKSENFGHAIIEALSAGKPVLTTTTTPFVQLEAQGAGKALPPDALQEQLPAALQYFADLDDTQWQQASQRATSFAASFVQLPQLQQQYHQLFETP